MLLCIHIPISRFKTFILACPTAEKIISTATPFFVYTTVMGEQILEYNELFKCQFSFTGQGKETPTL